MARRRRFTRLSVESLETRRMFAFATVDLPPVDPGTFSVTADDIVHAQEQEAQALQDAPAGLQGKIGASVWNAFKEIESLVLDHFVYQQGSGLPLSKANVPSAPEAVLNDAGEVLLEITLDQYSDAALARLETAGFRVEEVIPEYGRVLGWMGGLNLRALEAITEIGQVRFPLPAVLREPAPAGEAPVESDLVAAPPLPEIELDPEILQRAQVKAGEHLAAAGAPFKQKTSRAFREGIAEISALIYYGDDPAAAGPLPISSLDLQKSSLAQVTDSGRVLLEIDLADFSANALARLEESGLEIAAQFRETQRVLGWISALDVPTLAAVGEVMRIAFKPSIELDPRLQADPFVQAVWLQPWWQDVLDATIVPIGPQLPPPSGGDSPVIVIGGITDDDSNAEA